MSLHRGLKVVGLFAGIGGIERGLSEAGHEAKLLCEIDPGAQEVLSERFPNAKLQRDVRRLKILGNCDILTAGFPCQDLSQAGRTAGIKGQQSSLVEHVFRLLDSAKRKPEWLLLENVSFMLQLDRGEAMRYLVRELEDRRFRWAYRVVDTRAFGLPQRRQRVILLASRRNDPREPLFADDCGEEDRPDLPDLWRGFYWTEGTRGLGWAVDAVPTLKGGSTIGIPSPPAIWDPVSDVISTPEIRDAERLQGFPADWTLPALSIKSVRRGHRWKLVGNAVSVPVARWIGTRLLQGSPFDRPHRRLEESSPWPKAAWGEKGQAHLVECSMWPVQWDRPHLKEFIEFPTTPLSLRAATGFLGRARESTLQFEEGFLDAVARHVDAMSHQSVA